MRRRRRSRRSRRRRNRRSRGVIGSSWEVAQQGGSGMGGRVQVSSAGWCFSGASGYH